MGEQMKSISPYDQIYSDNYKLLIGAIVPRPIALVSTLNTNGTYNLAPFSFFTAISASPMIVAFCPMIRTIDGQKKDTVINIEREKECVINFVTEEMAERVNNCGKELQYGLSEFESAGLSIMPSEIVKAARVKESPIHYECKLRDILSYGDHVGAGSLISVEVIKIHINENLLDNGRINSDIYKPLGRGAGNNWIKCDHTFQLDRQTRNQIQ